MNLHEFQSKQLLADYGIPVPKGKPAYTVDEALIIARDLNEGGHATGWVVKAQVHAGGRGKAGGVKRAANPDELANMVSALLGSRLVTMQTTTEGLPVNCVLIEQQLYDIARELYLAMTVDRGRERVVLIASSAGGIDIEELAAEQPDKIMTTVIDPVDGLQADQCRKIGIAFGLTDRQIASLGKILQNLYRLFSEKDASLIEINPLITTTAGEFMALDAKIQIDDNALERHPELSELRDTSQEDARENTARQFGLNYITLAGNIACMVNGAGLAMATMDLIKLHGGEPANFLDVGGSTTAEKVAQAFKLILSDPKVKAILVNIFGGIVRCDLIAEGIIQAATEVGIHIPIVARLEGTNVERGRALLHASGLRIISAANLTDAAQKVVAAAKINVEPDDNQFYDGFSTKLELARAYLEMGDHERAYSILNEVMVSDKLELARAYLERGDPEHARSILDEVMEEGDEDQKQEAQALMQKVGESVVEANKFSA